MMRCHLLDGRFEDTEIDDLDDVVAVLEERRGELHRLTMGDIIDLLDKLGKELIRDPATSSVDGASYIGLWLRRENLERLCSLNYGRSEMLDRPCEVRPGTLMRAQPRGISCHWLPNNVATMAFFSLMLSILSKNASLLKVSEVSRPVLTPVLRKLGEISMERDGRKVSGATVLAAVCMISFDSSRTEDNVRMSRAADVRVVWGGSEAVQGVAALPQKDTCDTLLFGPKYSLAVFDQAYLEREGIDRTMRQLAMDAALFNQSACSSPQVVLLERGRVTAKEFAKRLAEGFESLPPRLLGAEKPESMCLDVINARGRYLLSEDRDIVMSPDLGWTVLIDSEEGLPEPVQGRCVFVREVDDLLRAAGWLTRKVQTVALCVGDTRKREEFAERASYAGVDRFVLPGEMNDFTLPWDGMLPLGRMVRWVTVRREKDAQ
ncbi:MAG: hypothetical protein ISF22_01245 [Methanomassiliicoccus sp.]|nr:hypothetical protein [Methanomassiliicoccus sp.]